MIRNLKGLFAALLLAAAAFGAGAVFTAGAQAQTTVNGTQTTTVRRGQWHSTQNLIHIRRRLEGVVRSLQMDANDYGGHRVKAIQYLQQARAELDAAIDTRPGQH